MIDVEKWLDGVVDQPQRKKKSSLQRFVPVKKGLEESSDSFDSYDRSIGIIIVKVEKKKVAANATQKEVAT